MAMQNTLKTGVFLIFIGGFFRLIPGFLIQIKALFGMVWWQLALPRDSAFSPCQNTPSGQSPGERCVAPGNTRKRRTRKFSGMQSALWSGSS
ncbi:hypothetical protein [Pseudomonas sp. HY13-MNA-CIBAN-0226]|uniref:hypothetical protein n=1 Tax=Pseudomonas sp. HY13-MNA-CIBAN-0226 TaxID=3140473 RepID=UPI00333137CE